MSRPPASKEKQASSRDRILQTCWVASLIFGTAVTIIFFSRPDRLAGFTIFPVWVWTASPMLVSLSGLLFLTRRFFWLFLWWLAITGLFFDTPSALWRALQTPPLQAERFMEEGTLRIITFNCHDQSTAIEKLQSYDVDVIFLQETVGQAEATRMQQLLFPDGSILWNPDVAILSRYSLQPVPLAKEFRGLFIAATLTFPISETETRQVYLGNLHLSSQPFRLDLWQPEFWQVYEKRRYLQTRELQSILQTLPKQETLESIIIGGDFNAPAGDKIYRFFPQQFQETFAVAGRGWGRTITSQTPAIRIDQLWFAGGLVPKQCETLPDLGSDHRPVIAEYIVP